MTKDKIDSYNEMECSKCGYKTEKITKENCELFLRILDANYIRKGQSGLLESVIEDGKLNNASYITRLLFHAYHPTTCTANEAEISQSHVIDLSKGKGKRLIEAALAKRGY